MQWLECLDKANQCLLSFTYSQPNLSHRVVVMPSFQVVMQALNISCTGLTKKRHEKVSSGLHRLIYMGASVPPPCSFCILTSVIQLGCARIKPNCSKILGVICCKASKQGSTSVSIDGRTIKLMLAGARLKQLFTYIHYERCIEKSYIFNHTEMQVVNCVCLCV